MKIFAQLEKAQLENTTSDTGSLPKGMITYRTDLNIAKVSNGTSMLALIDESSTQTLSGKTYATPNFTGAFNMAQAATPSNPSSGNNKFYFKADGKLYTLDSSGNEALVGSGSGGVKNLITNGSADDTAASIFTAYADSGSRPVDGTGGSPTVTTSITTTTPLDGTKAFLLTKTAANSQGQGWSVPFTVDPAYRAKSLKISVDYIVNSGTFVAGGAGVESDVIWYIYDVTNSQLIEPSNIKMFSNNSSLSDKFEATFQSSATGSSYRLIAHVQSVSALAYELKVDNITVSPQTYVYGSPITDWQDYSLIIGATTTAPTLGTTTINKAQWKQVGGDMEIAYDLRQTGSGSGGSGDYLFPIPSGYSMDTNRMPGFYTGSNYIPVGFGEQGDSGIALTVVPYDATRLIVQRDDGSLNDNLGSSASSLATADRRFSFRVKIPITGWSSSVQMSDNADTRICAARYSTAAAQSIPNNSSTIINFETSSFDTHAAVTVGASWKYTAPVAGYYSVNAKILFTVTATWAKAEAINFYLFKNGSEVSRIDYNSDHDTSATTNAISAQGSDIVQLAAGDFIDVRIVQNSGAALSLLSSASDNYITVERISGPSQIAASETVAARYKSSAAQSFTSGATTIIDFATQTFDTHGAVTTGASWKFTAPIAGKYQVSAHTGIGAATDGGARQLFIYKNGSVWSQSLQEKQSTTSVAIYVQVCDLVQCNAGDTIDLRYSQNSGGTLSFTSISDRIWVSILRVGN